MAELRASRPEQFVNLGSAVLLAGLILEFSWVLFTRTAADAYGAGLILVPAIFCAAGVGIAVTGPPSMRRFVAAGLLASAAGIVGYGAAPGAAIALGGAAWGMIRLYSPVATPA